jgi:hypothetical protein
VNLSGANRKEEPEVTPDSSRFDLTPLREAVATWWQEHAGELDLQAAEGLALALSRVLAQVMLQTALTQSSGQRSYQGTHVPCPHSGGKARFVGYRRRWLRTLCGDQEIERAYSRESHPQRSAGLTVACLRDRVSA